MPPLDAMLLSPLIDFLRHDFHARCCFADGFSFERHAFVMLARLFRRYVFAFIFFAFMIIKRDRCHNAAVLMPMLPLSPPAFFFLRFSLTLFAACF